MFDIVVTENRYSSGLYAKHPIAFVRGQGALLWDQDGVEYLDCTSGHGVANLGHAHPAVVQAIADQAGRLITLTETYYNDQRSLLMERLVNLVPGMQRVYLCNSGTEAVEAALKFARLSTGRSLVVAAMRGFHGRTLGALSATWNKHYRKPFEPLVPGFEHIPYNNPEALEKTVCGETAAVLLEVVQGEGGVHLADPGYMQFARRLCSERGALLIVDEVQTGFGRTGQMFAIEHFDIKPDLMCVAKSLAGGVPMGATLIGQEVRGLGPGLHASTFGGNPLACAAALATLQVLEGENLIHQAADKGRYLIQQLGEIDSPLIREVRGLGLMVGVELKQKVAPYLQALERRGILALPAGMTVIRLLPPLVITREQIDRLVTSLADVLQTEVENLNDDPGE